MKKKILAALMGVVFLSACKADRVIVEVDQGEIDKAISGGIGEAEFAATFDFSGELDDSKKAMLDQIERIVRSNMDIVDFIVTGDGRKTQIEIEGTLPVASQNKADSGWYLKVEPFGNDGHIVSVETGPRYSDIHRNIRAVRSTFAPDPYHPTTVRYKGAGAQITVPAGYVDGDAKVMWTDTPQGRVSFRFADGLFDDVGGAFLYKP
jgi:hypothetical protein